MKKYKTDMQTTDSATKNATEPCDQVGPLVMHGHSCEKVPHTFKLGYLHSEDEDTPYDVDGITYCGRCHTFLDLQCV